jgi:hypothetical protein
MLQLTNAPQIRCFDNDEDFYNYCVDPRIVPMQSEKGYYYTTFNFTPQYIDDVENGIKFMIKDENSQIFKRGCVSVGLMSKPVELEQYFANV